MQCLRECVRTCAKARKRREKYAHFLSQKTVVENKRIPHKNQRKRFFWNVPFRANARERERIRADVSESIVNNIINLLTYLDTAMIVVRK